MEDENLNEFDKDASMIEDNEKIISETLVQNTKLFGFNGFICRRDYFLNCIYISIISSFFTLPYTYWVMNNAQSIMDYIFIQNLYSSAPFYMQIWLVLGSTLSIILGVSNVIRRLTDICGKVNIPLGIVFGLFTIFGGLALVTNPIFSIITSIVMFIMSLCLLFIPGRITSKMPYDVTKIFNWGAFFGTWIWGLFNKSYKTLWYLLLMFTPWSFSFQLICGLKGNKWAYKNKKWNDVKAFNAAQEKQTTIFSIVMLCIFPVLYFLFIIAVVILMALGIAVTVGSSPDNSAAAMQKLENGISKFSSLYFESHEITPDENKYYVLPSDWASYGFADKKDVIDMAATNASLERSKNDKSGKYHSKSSELPRTKIYSSKNGELLGEFVIDEKAIANSDNQFKAAFKAAINAYRFYKPTEK